MTIIDPRTGRAAYIGPNGEAALAPGDPRISSMGAQAWTMPDGRTAYYVPYTYTSAYNRSLLNNYSGGTGGGGTSGGGTSGGGTSGGGTSGGGTSGGGGSGFLVDPITGRLAFTGPNGEGGLAPNDPRVSNGTFPGLVAWTMPDGRIAYYVPGQNIQPGNVAALEAWEKANGEEGDEDQDETQNRSAHALLRQVLERYGLGSLSDWAWTMLQNDRSYEEVLLELRNRPEFQARFKAIGLRQQFGLNPVSPEDIIEYENTARDLMRSSGLPSGFYDNPDDFAELIGKGVSLQSVARRVEQVWDRVTDAPQEVRAAFADLFNVNGDQALAAFFFDPDRSEVVLERMARSAVAGGAMRAAGFDLDSIAAARVAGFDLQDQSVRAGFARLAQLRAVFNETMAERNDADLDAMREGVNAVFDIGVGADAIDRRVRTRVNTAGGGGGAFQTRGGLTGLRSG